MVGFVVGIAIVGTIALVRLFRQSRAGLKLRSSLSGIKPIEFISLGFVSILLVLTTSVVASAWVAFHIENAQILAGIREPRHRSKDDSPNNLSPNFRIDSIPPVTFPELLDMPLPDMTFPDMTFPDMTFPTVPPGNP